jgi:geranylgeranyl diphosphate/geranylgeranyl-bacteriochlorophyllide a reductase
MPGATALTVDVAVFSAGTREARVDLPQADALRIFSRVEFDRALLAQATSAGAVHVASRAQRVERAGTGWRVSAGPALIEAPWLCGADGPCGIVRKSVFKPFERRQLSIAAGVFVSGVTVRELVIRFTDRPRGYLWSFPRPDHLAVGTCAQATETTATEMQRCTEHWLDTYTLADGHGRQRYAWPIPSLSATDYDAEQPAGNDWMLLGDAAGLVDPITREGIFFALRSGQLAADALRHADTTARYAAAIRDELHGELRRAAHLKAAFFRPRFTTLLIDALNSSASIRAIMVDLIAGRQSYATLKRRLLGTLEFRLAWRLFRGA